MRRRTLSAQTLDRTDRASMSPNRLKFRTATYRDVANDLDRAVAWLESLGFPVAPTRVGDYHRHLNGIADALDNGTLESLLQKEGTQDLINSLFECTELRQIYQLLEPIADPELAARLGSFIKGPTAYRDERSSSSSNRARNIGFELSLGAQLLNSGISVEFHPDGDLRFHHDGYEVFIECKRPQVEHQVNSRVKDALRQLETRYRKAADPAKARGLVAVSATKIINPFGNYYRTASRATLDAGLSGALQKFIDDHGRKWQSPSDPRTLGCIVEFRAFVFVESENIPTTGGDLAMTERRNLDPEAQSLVASLAELFQRGIRP